MAVPFLAGVARMALRVLRWTTRRRIVGGEELLRAFAEDRRVIVAFWHAHLALVQIAWPGRKLCVQVSRHRDGEVVARAVAPFGIRAARGSATRGGVASIRQMLRAFEEGYDLAVVCDGPRGPRHVVKPGAVQLAAATGALVYPVAARPRRGWVVRRSWDRFVVPLPFTRVEYRVGEPLRVPREAPVEEREAARCELERRLLDLVRDLESRVS